MLFYKQKGSHSDTKFIRFAEYYLSEYCSESLREISLQGHFCTNLHMNIFEDVHKPFVNVTTVHTEECRFGQELPFNIVFPNVQTLKLGFNAWENLLAIRMQFNSVKHLWFFDRTSLNSFIKLKEEDIEEVFKLNPQIQSSVLILRFKYSSNFIARLQKYCPNVQVSHYTGEFAYYSFFSFSAFYFKFASFSKCFHRETFTHVPKLFKFKISDKYANSLQKLGEFYSKMYKT